MVIKPCTLSPSMGASLRAAAALGLRKATHCDMTFQVWKPGKSEIHGAGLHFTDRGLAKAL